MNIQKQMADMIASKVQEAMKGMKGINETLARLSMSIPKKADKPGDRKGKKKTQKGAIHKHGSVFLGRRISKLTPAQYRRKHAGVVRITPSYLLKHPAPRARNVRPISLNIMNLLRGGKDGAQ